MYKLILFLFFIACKVQGQQMDTLPEPKVDHVHIFTQKGWVEIDRDAFGTLQLEIQTLRLLNDSLTRRLKEQIEYRAYASEIIKCLTVRNRMGDIRVYFKDQIGGRIAYLRFIKRYKTEQ